MRQDIHTNLLGRSVKEPGYYGRKGKIAAVYLVNEYHLQFLIEFPDGSLETLNKENFILE